MRISDWSSDVCSSDLQVLGAAPVHPRRQTGVARRAPVDLPAGLEVELEAKIQRRTCDRLLPTDEAQARLLLPGPAASGGRGPLGSQGGSARSDERPVGQE